MNGSSCSQPSSGGRNVECSLQSALQDFAADESNTLNSKPQTSSDYVGAPESPRAGGAAASIAAGRTVRERNVSNLSDFPEATLGPTVSCLGPTQDLKTYPSHADSLPDSNAMLIFGPDSMAEGVVHH